MITAKVHCSLKVNNGESCRLEFQPDYADGSNKDWAIATPHLALSMTVKGGVANAFEPGDSYILQFVKEE